MSKDIGGRRRMGCRIAFFQLFEHLFLSRPQDRDQQRRIVQDQRAGHRDTELMGFGMLGNGVITAVRQQRQGIRKNGRSMRITSDINPAKRNAMAVKNEKRFLKQKRNALKNPGYSRHPVKTQASFKRLLKAV